MKAAFSAEVVETRYPASVAKEDPDVKRTLDYPGWRGKIVRLYLEFLDHAARLGRRRRPAATPAEFAAELGDSAPVLSEIFERARWGPDNPTPHDFYRASQASRQLLSTLRQAMVK